MRFLIRLVFGVIIIGAVAAVAVPMFVPTDYLRDQVIKAVKQQTGRDLAVAGETSFSIIPNIGVRLGQVTLSDPPAMGQGTTLSMDALNVNLRLLPLLSQQIEVDQFVLERPVFDLRVDSAGRRNWDFAAAWRERSQKARADSSEWGGPKPILAQAGGISAASLKDLRLGDVRIVDGTVKYSDVQTGTRQQIDALNIKLALARLSEPLEAEGTFDWQREQVTFNGVLASPQKLLENEASGVVLSITSAHVGGKFDGEAQLAEAPRAAGNFNGSSPSVRNLAAWLGSPVPTKGGFGAAKVTSKVSATPATITLSNLSLTMDGMTGTGSAVLQLSGAKPHLRSTLSLDKLDFNVFSRPVPVDVRAMPRPRAAAAPRDGGSSGDADSQSDQSLTDFIEELNQQEGGKKSRNAPLVRGWSQHALDFSGLSLVDADIDFTTGALLYDRIKVGRSVVKAVLKDGLLNADLNELKLYGGQGRGKLTLYGNRAVPALSAAFNLAGVSALPIMRDALAFDWISGRANFTVALSGAGRSENAMVRSLQGNGTVRFSDGAIEGLNIPQMIRSVSLGQMQGVKRSSRLKTDFSEVTGTYTVQNGVVRNSDLQLVGPLLRMTGAGTVDLPREWIDYSLEPRLVASLQGQGGAADLAGVVIPIKISGPLSNPRIKPDVERILQNPEAMAKQIGEVVKNLKSNKKDIGKVLDNLLGGSRGGAPVEGQPAQSGGASGGEQPAQKIRPEDLLNQIFR